ncbi:MAG: glycosyltransferase family 4 protein [Acidimicrobiaceae bacterium]|nr:glycosyltransferase family 4 protein [Acidimicrobiaceae bacterium]
MRALHRALHLFRLREVDLVWTVYTIPISPWLLTARAWRRTPVVYSIDATLKQLHDFGPLYGYFGGRRRARFAARNRVERLLMRRMTLLTPWSEWCARSMREDYGIPAERIRVLPPGVDLDLWRPSRAPVPGKSLPRGIFVGVDFERKGGDLLLEVFRRRFRGRLELDLVTRGDVPEEPGVRVHTGLGRNDPRLLELYRSADLFVLPTRADCFPVSALEGLACGLPVILGRTGGTSEVLEEGVQGYYAEPGDGEALAAALEGMISRPSLRQQMGEAGRSLAERRYDARRITTRLIGWMLELAGRPPGGDGPPSTRP